MTTLRYRTLQVISPVDRKTGQGSIIIRQTRGTVSECNIYRLQTRMEGDGI